MPDPSLLALSPRTATVLLAPDGARYALPKPAGFELRTAEGLAVATGRTERSVVQFNRLEPGTGYRFSCEFGMLDFVTPKCAGLVDARVMGADQTAADNTQALQAAIDAVPKGGTLFVPEGLYRTGPLFLKSDMTLHLAEGARLADHGRWNERIIFDEQDDTGRVLGTWEGLPDKCFAALINAIACERLTITGEGTLDGGGDRGDWWSWPKEARRGARRPRTLFLAHCRDIALTGITVCNSPSWTVHPFHTARVTAAALKIVNPPDSPNTDGFNPESCEDVRLAGIHFSVGDDCIAVKAGKRGGEREDHLAPTRRLSITHCLMERGHGAVVLGSEMSGDITDVSIENCRFVGTDRGLRIKTRRGRGGRVANVDMRNVEMDRVATAFAANAFYFCDADGTSETVQSRTPAPVTRLTPEVSGIRLENIRAENVQLAAVALLGLPEAPITGISIRGMQVTFDPEAEADVPLMASHVPACRHARIWAEYAEIDGDVTVLERDLAHAD